MAPGTPIPADGFYDKPLSQPHLRGAKNEAPVPQAPGLRFKAC